MLDQNRARHGHAREFDHMCVVGEKQDLVQAGKLREGPECRLRARVVEIKQPLGVALRRASIRELRLPRGGSHAHHPEH